MLRCTWGPLHGATSCHPPRGRSLFQAASHPHPRTPPCHPTSHHTSTQVLRPNNNNRVVHPFPLIHVRTSSAHLKDHFSLKWHYSNWHFDRRRCFSNILNGSLRNTSLWTIVICDFPCIWGKGAVKENKEVDEKL